VGVGVGVGSADQTEDRIAEGNLTNFGAPLTVCWSRFWTQWWL
jgi:hypothetical protein